MNFIWVIITIYFVAFFLWAIGLIVYKHFNKGEKRPTILPYQEFYHREHRPPTMN